MSNAWLLSVSSTRVAFTTVAMLGLALSTLVVIVRPHRIAVLVAMFGVTLGISWILAWVAEQTDFRDADGWADCWPNCSAVQTATRLIFTYGTLALAAVGVISVASLVRGRRATR